MINAEDLNDHTRGVLEFEAGRLEALAADLRRAAQGKRPTLADMARAPLLECWHLVHREVPCLRGMASDHPRCDDGPLTTTDVHLLDPTAGYARTLSRWYRLGARRPFQPCMPIPIRYRPR